MSLGPEPFIGPRDARGQLATRCGCFPGGTKQMRLPTAEEKATAILDARKTVAEYLHGIGKLEVFDTFTKDEICGMIRAAQEGVQDSLRRQTGAAFGVETPL